MFEKYATTLDARFEANETFWFEMLWHSDSTCYDIMIRHVMTFWFEMLWHSDSKSYDILKRNVMTFWFELLWHSDSKCYDILICHAMTLMVTPPSLFFCICPTGFACFICLCLRPPRSSTGYFFHDPLIFPRPSMGFALFFIFAPWFLHGLWLRPPRSPVGPESLI